LRATATQVQWHEAWTWVALLISMIVTGGYDLLATAGGTSNQEPRSSADLGSLATRSDRVHARAA